MAGKLLSSFGRYLAERRAKQARPKTKNARVDLPELVRKQTTALEKGSVEERRKAALNLHHYIPALSRRDATKLLHTLRRFSPTKKDTTLDGLIDTIIAQLNKQLQPKSKK